MKKRPKRINSDKRGLLHGPLRVEVEMVSPRHKKLCDGCSTVPEGRRLRLVEGTARAATTTIYCRDCGTLWFKDHIGDVRRALRRLSGEADVCVRLIDLGS